MDSFLAEIRKEVADAKSARLGVRNQAQRAKEEFQVTLATAHSVIGSRVQARASLRTLSRSLPRPLSQAKSEVDPDVQNLELEAEERPPAENRRVNFETMPEIMAKLREAKSQARIQGRLSH